MYSFDQLTIYCNDESNLFVRHYININVIQWSQVHRMTFTVTHVSHSKLNLAIIALLFQQPSLLAVKASYR